MNARVSWKSASIASILAATAGISCSSANEPVTAGGAYLELQNAKNVTTMPPPGACLDVGQKYTIAIQGADGQLKLIVDGADDARVSCRYDGARYDLTVSNRTASLTASGTIQGGKSTDAEVQVLASSGNIYRTSSKKCSIEFLPQQEEGKIRGNMTCDEITHTKLNNACGMSSSGSAPSYFSFSNCKGF